MAYNAKNITVLEGLQPVRERPGMYIGSTSVKGLNHLVYEILDNSVDEHLAGYCDKIIVSLNKEWTWNPCGFTRKRISGGANHHDNAACRRQVR